MTRRNGKTDRGGTATLSRSEVRREIRRIDARIMESHSVYELWILSRRGRKLIKQLEEA